MISNKHKKGLTKLANMLLRPIIREKRISEPLDFCDIRTILIVEVSLIGDEIMTIPFYSILRKNCPNAKITVIGMPWISKQLINQGLIDEIIEFDGLHCLESPKSWIANRKKIHNILKVVNEKNYDIGFEPRGDIRYCLFMHYTNAARKISFDDDNNSYLLNTSIKRDPTIVHEIDRRLSLLKMLGFKITEADRYPFLKLLDTQIAFNNEIVSSLSITRKKVIGIHPGASLEIKRYPYYPEVIFELSKIINNKEDYYVLVFQGKGEEDIAGRVYDSARDGGFDAALICEPLEEYIGLIGSCDYMICNDSGAGHIAAAYGIPVTVVFGPVRHDMYRPLGNNSVYIISHDLPCKPCKSRTCLRKDDACLSKIQVIEVCSVIHNMILNANSKEM